MSLLCTRDSRLDSRFSGLGSRLSVLGRRGPGRCARISGLGTRCLVLGRRGPGRCARRSGVGYRLSGTGDSVLCAKGLGGQVEDGNKVEIPLRLPPLAVGCRGGVAVLAQDAEGVTCSPSSEKQEPSPEHRAPSPENRVPRTEKTTEPSEIPFVTTTIGAPTGGQQKHTRKIQR